jgi:hypothetical protein
MSLSRTVDPLLLKCVAGEAAALVSLGGLLETQTRTVLVCDMLGPLALFLVQSNKLSVCLG